MQITTDTHDGTLHFVSIGLTRAEAGELRDALDQLLASPEAGTKTHQHVSAADYQTDIAVWITE